MHLVVIGLNHKTAPVGLREKLSIAAEQLAGALTDLSRREGVAECLILSTCNRTEVYAYTRTRANDARIIGWISEFCGVAESDFQPHLYSHSGHKAAEHLFRVASGIDSMVIGEAQILGQVKDAYAAASAAGSTGKVLNSLFQQSITVGKRVRAETKIGRGAFSVGSVAVQLARSVFDELAGRTVLVVGAGEMGKLTVTHLRSCGVCDFLVTSRTYEHAATLAARFDGRPVPFENLPELLWKADIVITSTGAKQPIITSKMAASAMHARRGRPVFFIDIAVPRDIEPGVADMDNVFVYNIDDLQSAVDADAENRRREVEKAERIIADEIDQFTVKFRTFDAVPVITALREKFDGIRSQEFDRLRSRLAHLSPEDVEIIDTTMRSVVNKICHAPMIQIRETAAGADSSAKLEAICDLFGICPADNNEEEKPDSD